MVGISILYKTVLEVQSRDLSIVMSMFMASSQARADGSVIQGGEVSFWNAVAVVGVDR